MMNAFTVGLGVRAEKGGSCSWPRPHRACRRPPASAGALPWTQQHDLLLSYVGHARQWDRIEIDGRLEAKDCTVTYRHGARKLAVLTIGRDRDSLAAEIELEKAIAAAG